MTDIKLQQSLNSNSHASVLTADHGLCGRASPVSTATGFVNENLGNFRPLQNRHPLTNHQKFVTRD